MAAHTPSWAAVWLAALTFCWGCDRFQRKHIPVDELPDLGYPSCDEPKVKVAAITSQHLRAGPAHMDETVVERYRVEDRGCLTAVVVRQEWPLGTADVEVLYDQRGVPVRAWKRMTLPGIERAEELADIRRYELRTDPVGIKWRTQQGKLKRELLKGGDPKVVIGPGRGLISMWIRRAKLKVGQKVRELALDIRELERIRPVTLLREKDMKHPELGPVQVYTFYGRETVFANAAGFVIGDLAGLRPHHLLKTPEPPPLPMHGPVDPVHTP